MDEGTAVHFRELAEHQFELGRRLQDATDDGTRRAVATQLRDVRRQMLEMLLHPEHRAGPQPRARRRWDAA